MIDNMYDVMKRINEIKGRFGLNRRRMPAVNRGGDDFRPLQNKAAKTGVDEGRVRPDARIAGITGKNIEEIRKLADYYASVNRVPSALVRAVIEAESNYNPHAVSPKGAKGLMQLMPSVIQEMGIRDPFDPNENINAGTGLLRDLLSEYNGDYTKALAAYNAGRGAVTRSGGLPDYPETREYVKKVIDAYMKNSK